MIWSSRQSRRHSRSREELLAFHENRAGCWAMAFCVMLVLLLLSGLMVVFVGFTSVWYLILGFFGTTIVIPLWRVNVHDRIVSGLKQKPGEQILSEVRSQS